MIETPKLDHDTAVLILAAVRAAGDDAQALVLLARKIIEIRAQEAEARARLCKDFSDSREAMHELYVREKASAFIAGQRRGYKAGIETALRTLRN